MCRLEDAGRFIQERHAGPLLITAPIACSNAVANAFTNGLNTIPSTVLSAPHIGCRRSANSDGCRCRLDSSVSTTRRLRPENMTVARQTGQVPTGLHIRERQERQQRVAESCRPQHGSIRCAAPWAHSSRHTQHVVRDVFSESSVVDHARASILLDVMAAYHSSFTFPWPRQATVQKDLPREREWKELCSQR